MRKPTLLVTRRSFIGMGLYLLLTYPVLAQRCVIRVEVVNHNRYAYHTAEECEGVFHSAPWGNWGVNSNMGRRLDTDQFQGWRQGCNQTKVEWNSCSAAIIAALAI
jgi:hypothetical protein